MASVLGKRYVIKIIEAVSFHKELKCFLLYLYYFVSGVLHSPAKV